MLSRETGRGAEPVAVEGAYRSADPRLPNTQLATLLWTHLPSVRPATDRFSTDYVTISAAAEHLDMTPRTLERMIAAGSLTGYVDWSEIQSKLIPTRPRRQ
jgi:hypothetical protein